MSDKTSLTGRGITGGLTAGSGADTVPQTSQTGAGLTGSLILGMGGGPPPAVPPLPATRVRVSQEVLEAVLGLSPPVRVSQEVLEAVVSAEAPEVPAAFTVTADPRVRWLATVPVNAFTVRTSPRVEWGGQESDPLNRFVVHTAPQVIWNTGPGTASTECISADGVMPPPDDDTPPESIEENYVF